MSNPQLKIKVLPRFPSSVSVVAPMLLSTTGGNYTLSLDMNSIIAQVSAGVVLPTNLNIGVGTGTSLALGGISLGGFHDISAPRSILIGSTASDGAALLINSTVGNVTKTADVAGIQNSVVIDSHVTADAAGTFTAITVKTGGVLADLAGHRIEVPMLAGSATLGIFKGYRVDDLTSLTVGTSKYAFHAEGVGAGGASKFGTTTINADSVALTVGRGTVGDNTGFVVNGGASGNGAGAYFILEVGGTNSAMFGSHSAIYGGTYNQALTINSASGTAIELSPGRVGTSFSGTIATSFLPSGGVAVGTTSDPGAGNLALHPGSSITPASNGDLVFQATSNTSFTVKYKGSDGTVRSGSITLS